MKIIPKILGYKIKYPHSNKYENFQFTKRIKYFSNGRLELEIKYIGRIYKRTIFGILAQKVPATAWVDSNLFIPIPVPPTETIVDCNVT